MCSILHGSAFSQCLRCSCGGDVGQLLLEPGAQLWKRRHRVCLEFWDTGTEQSSQQIRMETEVNHHGTTTEKRITAAVRRTRVY